MEKIKVHIPKKTQEDIEWLIEKKFFTSASEVLRSITVRYMPDFIEELVKSEKEKYEYDKIEKERKSEKGN